MTGSGPHAGQVRVLVEELRALLIGEGVTDGVNLLLRQHDSQIQIYIMAVDVGRLGVLLATLSDPAELHDPGSLSRRITPGEEVGIPGRWQYELIAGRYPVGRDIVFSAKIRLPVTDLPDVITRIRRVR